MTSLSPSHKQWAVLKISELALLALQHECSKDHMQKEEEVGQQRGSRETQDSAPGALLTGLLE